MRNCVKCIKFKQKGGSLITPEKNQKTFSTEGFSHRWGESGESVIKHYSTYYASISRLSPTYRVQVWLSETMCSPYTSAC